MFKFKKIASVLASTAMISSTVALAAAASYPAPFVSGGSPDVAVVYGSNQVGGVDIAAAQNILTDLGGEVIESGTSGTTTTVTGESLQLAKSTDSFNLGNNWNSFYTTIDDDELSTILAAGVYENDDNDDFDYQQEVTLGSATLVHFTDNDFNDEEPVIGFDLAGGTTILNYTLDFTPDNAESDEADWDSLEGTTIEMLGKEYYILSASNSTNPVLEFLDSANTVLLSEGDTVTVEVGDTSYDVSISFIGTSNVKLNINGEVTPALNEDDTRKLSTGDYVGIREILVQDYAGGSKQVEFSIGTGKIKLTNGAEIEVNGEDVSDLDMYDGHVLNAYVTQGSSSTLDKFIIEWKLDSGNSGDTWLAYGTDSTEIVMPVFNNLKLSLGNFAIDAEEMTSIDPDGDDGFTLSTTVTDGDVSLNLLYANSTGTGFEGTGESSTQKLLTTNGTTISWDSDSAYFVATWIDGDDAESYVLEVSEIDDTTPADNSTTITSIASGSNEAITLDIGESDQIGEITFQLTAANEDSETATIVISGSGNVYADKIVTAEGLKIQLPWEHTVANYTADPGADGAFSTNSSAEGWVAADGTSWVMNLTEETENGNINAGKSFTATLGFNVDETSVTSVGESVFSGGQDFETTDGSDDFVGYMLSDLATMTMFATGGDQDSLDVTYHGTEAYGEVFLSESGAALTDGESGPIGPAMMDSEVTASLNKNLIVVGGSCVNTVAAQLLGSSTPLCGPDFTAATGVGAGSYLIETFDRANKVATLVAGYNAGDTTNAATALTTQPIDTTAGMKYTGTTATSVEAVL